MRATFRAVRAGHHQLTRLLAPRQDHESFLDLNVEIKLDRPAPAPVSLAIRGASYGPVASEGGGPRGEGAQVKDEVEGDEASLATPRPPNTNAILAHVPDRRGGPGDVGASLALPGSGSSALPRARSFHFREGRELSRANSEERRRPQPSRSTRTFLRTR